MNPADDSPQAQRRALWSSDPACRHLPLAVRLEVRKALANLGIDVVIPNLPPYFVEQHLTAVALDTAAEWLAWLLDEDRYDEVDPATEGLILAMEHLRGVYQ